MKSLAPAQLDIAAGLRWLLLDVDGVLTDGRLVYGPDGEELKTFHVRDGLALKLAQRTGLKVAVLSGRDSPALRRRVRDLGLDSIQGGRSDKGRALEEFLEVAGCEASEVAAIGDDLPDLVVLERAGLGFAPADAAPEVRVAADVVLERRGGDGAVREMVEILLRARGVWEQLVDGFRV